MSFKEYYQEHLNEALTKGIPADAIQTSYDLPTLIKSFAKNTEIELGVRIDLKKCNFADTTTRELELSLKSSDKLTAPRMFFAWTGDQYNYEGASYLILTRRGYTVDYTYNPKGDLVTDYDDYLEFKDFAKYNIKEIIPVGVTEYPLIKKFRRH